MNYQIIVDEEKLKEFIDFLPELGENECYYLCLFSRSKYAKNEDGSNKFPHIKTDKNQLKRFLSKKEYMLDKIKQLEIPFGAYKTKDGDPTPQESLALYITINPRDQRKALFKLQKRLIDILECNGNGYNVNAEALSAVQKSKSKTYWVDFDIDSKDIDLSLMNDIMPPHCYKILETRGGYHIMIDTSKTKEAYTNKWYQKIMETYDVDQANDNMIPVPGTFQGSFVPTFIA